MMKRLREKARDHQRGLALVATLVLLMFLASMIAAVLKGNLNRRRYIEVRQDNIVALCLAEAGLHEALHTLAASPAAASLHGGNEQGVFDVECRIDGSAPDAYEIVSIGQAHRREEVSAGRTIRACVEVLPEGSTPRLRTLSWSAE